MTKADKSPPCWLCDANNPVSASPPLGGSPLADQCYATRGSGAGLPCVRSAWDCTSTESFKPRVRPVSLRRRSSLPPLILVLPQQLLLLVQPDWRGLDSTHCLDVHWMLLCAKNHIRRVEDVCVGSGGFISSLRKLKLYVNKGAQP